MVIGVLSRTAASSTMTVSFGVKFDLKLITVWFNSYWKDEREDRD
jgi:hypothetical protein